MKYHFKLISLTIFLVNIFYGQKKTLDSIQKLDEVILKANTILGSKYVAQNRTGASYYLSEGDLSKFGNTDINRALRSVPGVNLYEEDGFGLRPNISLRGTSPQRSSKITIMEDGVLISPAPYSSPAAYYFPTVSRMEALEILKGSSQIQYGPFTTGGAINMVSTSIPDSLKVKIKSRFGNFNSGQVYAAAGQSNGRLGYLLEYHSNKSDGFKKLKNLNTGFDITDLMGKIRFSSKKESNIPQYIEFKYHYYDEVSNETYLGLTSSDFESDPYQRYLGSQKDQMNAEQSQFMITHVIDISNNIKVITNAYQNSFLRNWYKLDDVIFDGEKKKLSNVLENPLTFPNHLQVLKGEINSQPDALKVKANNRVYFGRGIQTKFDYHWYDSSGSFHDIEIGARIHYDEEDRFQWEDGYSIFNMDMTLTSNGSRGAEGNRISSAGAIASYILYKYKWKSLTITPGVRYENINLKRDDFGKNDPNRTGKELKSRENSLGVFIPGFGFNYNLPKNLSVFGGIHKGFSPPGNTPGELAEESINYELGTRFYAGRLRGEWIGYFNNYSNLLGSDLAATGGTGSLDQFNAGKVHVSGFEFLLNFDLLNESSKIKIPLSFAYTLTNAFFRSDFGSTQGIWGDVSFGDRVPLYSSNQCNFSLGIIYSSIEFNFNFRYNGSFDTQASNNGMNDTMTIDSNSIIDLSLKYNLASKINLTLNAINLLNKKYTASRVPSGYRPGHPFGIYAGIEFKL